MEKKLRIILERARDGIEPLEDLERELLNLHLVSKCVHEWDASDMSFRTCIKCGKIEKYR